MDVAFVLRATDPWSQQLHEAQQSFVYVQGGVHEAISNDTVHPLRRVEGIPEHVLVGVCAGEGAPPAAHVAHLEQSRRAATRHRVLKSCPSQVEEEDRVQREEGKSWSLAEGGVDELTVWCGVGDDVHERVVQIAVG